MAKVLDQNAVTALGLSLRIKGNVGAITWRQFNKLKHIAYRERVKPAVLSPKQQAHRTRFKRGYEQWRSLTDDEREHWKIAADRISSRQIAPHLFLRVWWRQDQHFLNQMSYWYSIPLVLPGP